MEVVDHFKHQELRDYYEKWYNPENQCVVVVGDIDVDQTEAKIKRLFGDIRPKGQSGKVVTVEVPNSIFLLFKHRASTPEERKYVGYWTDCHKTSAALTMLNTRYEDEALKPDCPYLSASADDDDYCMSSTKEAFSISCEARDSLQTQALTAAFIECRRAAEYGFTEEEYQRYKANRISSLDNLLMSADKRESTTLVSEYYNHYLYGTDFSSVEDFVAIQKAITNQTTLQEVNQRMKELLPERNDNLVIGSWNIEKDSAYYPTEKELEAALMAGREAPLTPYVDELKGAKLLNELPQKGTIVREDSIPEFGFTRLSLSNGATVLIKHTDIDKSQVLFKAYGKCGWSRYGEEDDPNISMLGSVVFGNNGLTVSQIGKLLAGKRANLSNAINQRYYTFSQTSAKTQRPIKRPSKRRLSVSRIARPIQSVLFQIPSMSSLQIIIRALSCSQKMTWRRSATIASSPSSRSRPQPPVTTHSSS